MQTQSHAVLSFEVRSKTSVVTLRHQMKDDKAFCYPSRQQARTAAVRICPGKSVLTQD